MNYTFISLILLSLLIFSSLSWLVIKTLKEGKEALKDIVNDTK